VSDPLFAGDDDGNTPLEAEEREQLIPSYITTRAELNEAELANIADAAAWLAKRRRDALDPRFLNELHARMYGDVWKWAGRYRTTPRNIGIEAYRIPTELHVAVDDARYWVAHATYPPDEIAIRFSHRVVAIHPYPNGNGRLSRMVGDIVAGQLDRPRFSWGRVNLIDASVTRQQYIAVLKDADRGDFAPLIAFARA
jgi:Fic-DOC domain mobile mystery protein B